VELVVADPALALRLPLSQTSFNRASEVMRRLARNRWQA